LLRRGPAAYEAAIRGVTPWSLVALLATLVLLFAFQGDAILAQGATPLLRAAIGHDVEAVRALLEHGALVDRAQKARRSR